MNRLDAPLSLKDNLFFDLPSIETPRLVLRKMTLADAQDMYDYARDPVVSRYTVWEHHRSPEDALTFLRGVIQNYEKGIVENWGIVHRETGRFIGTGGFFSWERDHRRAEIQYALSHDYAGKGFMTEVVRRIVGFGFAHMGLNRIEARCMLENFASERVMQKAGMRFEGIMREGIYAKGRFHDLKVYAILYRDWESLKLAERPDE